MKIYICGHCYENLGELLEDSPEPHCSVHPNGIRTIIETEDGNV